MGKKHRRQQQHTRATFENVPWICARGAVPFLLLPRDTWGFEPLTFTVLHLGIVQFWSSIFSKVSNLFGLFQLTFSYITFCAFPCWRMIFLFHPAVTFWNILRNSWSFEGNFVSHGLNARSFLSPISDIYCRGLVYNTYGNSRRIESMLLRCAPLVFLEFHLVHLFWLKAMRSYVPTELHTHSLIGFSGWNVLLPFVYYARQHFSFTSLL